MPMFVHLTPEKNVPAIRRGGIGMSKFGGGVYATPVLRTSSSRTNGCAS